MATSVGDINIYKVSVGDLHNVSKISVGEKVVYSSGNTVTYHVDTGIMYQEEVDEEESCLSPKTFTPVKEGWTFLGWRQDTSASSSVLGSLAMGDNPVTLYAVFRQTITISYNGNGSTGGSTAAQTGARYYNNGNVSNPSFSLRSNGFSRSGYNFVNWAHGSAGGTQYTTGASVTLSENATFYAVWKAAEESYNVSTTSVDRNNVGLCPRPFSFGFDWIGNGSVYQSVTVTVTQAYGEEWHENQWFDIGVGITDDSNAVRNYVSLGRASTDSPTSAQNRTVTITIPNENKNFYLFGGPVAWSGAGVGYVKVKISNPVKLTRR